MLATVANKEIIIPTSEREIGSQHTPKSAQQCRLACSPGRRKRLVIPVDGHDLKDLKKYLQPLQLLGSIAAELTKLTYGTGCQIQAVALVEEQKSGGWCLA